jgi:hypothetical protein
MAPRDQAGHAVFDHVADGMGIALEPYARLFDGEPGVMRLMG